MIKHIVVWMLQDYAEGASKMENARKVKAAFEGLKHKIKEIKHIEIGININTSSTAYNIVLYSEFANTADLAAYQNHPEHLIAADFVGKVCMNRRVIDYEV
jgi:hypothetical protein